jgi:hypothetical protein
MIVPLVLCYGYDIRFAEEQRAEGIAQSVEQGFLLYALCAMHHAFRRNTGIVTVPFFNARD